MGNSLRCCISCILPCGALDVIRIVHSNGQVDEVTGSIFAGDIMKANPKHVLRKHCPEGVRIIVLPPDALLQRGRIYFLCPLASNNSTSPSPSVKNGIPRKTNYRKADLHLQSDPIIRESKTSTTDRNLTQIVSERKCTVGRDGRRSRGRMEIWQPHLRSISEDLSYCT